MKIFNKNEWKKVKLGDVFDLQMGKTPLRENKLYWDKGEYHWISISDMNFSEKYISSTKEKITELAVKKSGIKIIPKNTVIMSFKLSIGKVKIVNEDIYSNEAIMAFIPKTNNFIDENFLYYSLKGVRWNEGINKAVKGLTLNKALISQKEIFLPNLAIQQEIASNLDSIADFLDLRRKQLNYLKELNKSLFTRMFGTPEYNEKGWNFISLKDISYTKGEYGSNKPAINYNGGYRYIRITDINATGELKTEKVGVSDEEIEAQKYALKENDILFARSGATVGKNFLYNKKYGKCIFAGYLIRFKLNPHLISTKYLKIYLDTNYYWNWVKNCQNIVAQPNINAKQYGEDLKIMLPPIELQNKFAERVEKIEKLSFIFDKPIIFSTFLNLYKKVSA